MSKNLRMRVLQRTRSNTLINQRKKSEGLLKEQDSNSGSEEKKESSGSFNKESSQTKDYHHWVLGADYVQK